MQVSTVLNTSFRRMWAKRNECLIQIFTKKQGMHMGTPVPNTVNKASRNFFLNFREASFSNRGSTRPPHTGRKWVWLFHTHHFQVKLAYIQKSNKLLFLKSTISCATKNVIYVQILKKISNFRAILVKKNHDFGPKMWFYVQKVLNLNIRRGRAIFYRPYPSPEECIMR